MLEHESRLLLVETRLGALDHGNELLRGACVAVRELNGVRGTKTASARWTLASTLSPALMAMECVMGGRGLQHE